LSLVPLGVALLFFKVSWPKAALAYGILLLLWAAWRAHVRVVIEGFDDYRPDAERGDDGEPRKDAGSAVLLANRLAVMRELYGFVDDPDKTPTPGRATGATVQLDDAAGVLRSAVTTQSTVSLGPISLPFGAVMSLVQRIAQAPRLRGAIHGEEGNLVVTAELTMEGQPYAWRVPGDPDEGVDPGCTLEELINDELAYQVFSDLTLQRQARWPATKYWLRALGKMAEGQRRPRNRRLLLKEAESNFAEALAQDEQFYLARLNLGIVYRRLGLGQSTERSERYMLAARRVFERAIELQPDRWEAYHALADALSAARDPEGSLEMIAGLCDRALTGCDDRAARARILDLKAHAEEEAGALGAAMDSRRLACETIVRELAWTRLRQARTQQSSRLPTLEKQAAQCLVNLAWTSWRYDAPAPEAPEGAPRPGFRRVYAAARLAVRLSDIDASAHERLARAATEAHRVDIATDELSAAARIGPANPTYAAGLAKVLAETHDKGRAEEACKRAERLIDFGEPEQTSAQDSVIAAYRALGDETRAAQLESRKTLVGDLAHIRDDPEIETRGGLRALLDSFDPERDWEIARIKSELGRAVRDGAGDASERGRLADTCFREALLWFMEHQPDDGRVAELHSDRAEALALQPECSGEALAEAETAVTRDPLRASYRQILARAYAAGNDLDNACAAAGRALLLQPDLPALHFEFATLKWELAESLADPGAHKRERREAAKHFEQALKLYETDQRDERRTTHWWLAMSYFAMSDFADVPAHLRFVFSSIAPNGSSIVDDRGLEAVTLLWLGMTYRKLQKFTEAERHLASAITLAKRLRESVRLDASLAAAVKDERWPLGVVLALAYMQRAGCHADREGDLKVAAKDLANALAVLETLDRDCKELHGLTTDAYSDFEAECGRVLLADDNPIEAIEALQGSAEIDPGEADVYLLLARAHARAAEQRLEDEAQDHIRRALGACRRTREIAGEGHPDTDSAAEIEQQLAVIGALSGEPIAAAAGDAGARPVPPPSFPGKVQPGGTRAKGAPPVPASAQRGV
jgi:tetratricopeptide (TPR) repeat protein